MADVTIDVETLEGAIRRTVEAVRPGPHEHRDDWVQNQQTLKALQRAVVAVRGQLSLGRLVVLSPVELALLEPYLDAPS